MEFDVTVFDGSKRMSEKFKSIYDTSKGFAESLVHLHNRIALWPILSGVVRRHELPIGLLKESAMMGEHAVLSPIDLKPPDGQMNHRTQETAS
jgi:hypothetical protein